MLPGVSSGVVSKRTVDERLKSPPQESDICATCASMLELVTQNGRLCKAASAVWEYLATWGVRFTMTWKQVQKYPSCSLFRQLKERYTPKALYSSISLLWTQANAKSTAEETRHQSKIPSTILSQVIRVARIPSRQPIGAHPSTT